MIRVSRLGACATRPEKRWDLGPRRGEQLLSRISCTAGGPGESCGLGSLSREPSRAPLRVCVSAFTNLNLTLTTIFTHSPQPHGTKSAEWNVCSTVHACTTHFNSRTRAVARRTNTGKARDIFAAQSTGQSRCRVCRYVSRRNELPKDPTVHFPDRSQRPRSSSLEMVGGVGHFMGQRMCDYICR